MIVTLGVGSHKFDFKNAPISWHPIIDTFYGLKKMWVDNLNTTNSIRIPHASSSVMQICIYD